MSDQSDVANISPARCGTSREVSDWRGPAMQMYGAIRSDPEVRQIFEPSGQSLIKPSKGAELIATMANGSKVLCNMINLHMVHIRRVFDSSMLKVYCWAVLKQSEKLFLHVFTHCKIELPAYLQLCILCYRFVWGFPKQFLVQNVKTRQICRATDIKPCRLRCTHSHSASSVFSSTENKANAR